MNARGEAFNTIKCLLADSEHTGIVVSRSALAEACRAHDLLRGEIAKARLSNSAMTDLLAGIRDWLEGQLDAEYDTSSPAPRPNKAMQFAAEIDQLLSTDEQPPLSSEPVCDETTKKAFEILADYEAGSPLQISGNGWLVRFATHIALASQST